MIDLLKKLKKKDIIKIIILLVVLFLIFGVLLFFYGRMQKKDTPVNVSTVEDTIDDYGYYINDNASQYYKDEFNILKELINNNGEEEEITKQIGKLYVIDLLSLNNKINKYEVTSSQYYFSDKQSMHTQKVMDKFYNTMEDNAYDDRKQELPEVSNVTISSTTKDKYDLGDNNVDCYVIEYKIDYVKDLGYDDDVFVTLVPDGNHYSVVKYEVAT